MRWLITGGCGFIGTSLVSRLIADGFTNIRIIDNLSIGSRADLLKITAFKEIDPEKIDHEPNGVELLVGDIKDYGLASKLSIGCDVIVHLAANTGVSQSIENPMHDMESNVIGIVNYLEAARLNGIKKFVFASSGATVGEVLPPIHEEIAPHPVSPYGASKLAGEAYCSAYKRTFDIDTVALRFGNVYGPGSIHKSSVVAKFIRRALAGETLELYGDGMQTRDFIYIDDLIEAVVRAATVSGIGGETFQIASSRETTIGEISERLLSVLTDAGVADVQLNITESRLGDVKRNFSDTSKAQLHLGWKSKVNLNEGLRKTVAYFLKNSE